VERGRSEGEGEGGGQFERAADPGEWGKSQDFVSPGEPTERRKEFRPVRIGNSKDNRRRQSAASIKGGSAFGAVDDTLSK